VDCRALQAIFCNEIGWKNKLFKSLQMKSYFNTIKKPKYIKLCGDGDVIDGPIDVIQD
jgi:hypothetical protein